MVSISSRDEDNLENCSSRNQSDEGAEPLLTAMNNLITQNKGDIGVASVIKDLYLKGFSCAKPISEHLPFDLIIINSEFEIKRISVKYVSLIKGRIAIPLRTISSNSKGYKIKKLNLKYIDGFAIYCPYNDSCYYVDTKTLLNFKSQCSLRILDNNAKETSSTKWGKDFITPDIFWKIDRA